MAIEEITKTDRTMAGESLGWEEFWIIQFRVGPDAQWVRYNEENYPDEDAADSDMMTIVNVRNSIALRQDWIGHEFQVVRIRITGGFRRVRITNTKRKNR